MVKDKYRQTCGSWISAFWVIYTYLDLIAIQARQCFVGDSLDWDLGWNPAHPSSSGDAALLTVMGSQELV